MKPVQTVTSFKKAAQFIHAKYNIGVELFSIKFLVGCIKGMREIRKFRDGLGLNLNLF